jgi:hypothetical protein
VPEPFIFIIMNNGRSLRPGGHVPPKPAGHGGTVA